MKFLNFFLLLWVIFALLDPDPDSESGSTDPIESGSATLAVDRAPPLLHAHLGLKHVDVVVGVEDAVEN
jgi:hypothetical protein